MKPFVILALPRTGTAMLCNALKSHPDIDEVVHEFKGSESEFLEHPQILSNYVKDWMTGPIVHMYREDACAGARSMMMMAYHFPDGVVDLPEHEVITLAKKRQKWDEEMRQAADYSFSYESLLTDGVAEILPVEFSGKFLDHVGLNWHPLTTTVRPVTKILLRNEEAIQCLSV